MQLIKTYVKYIDGGDTFWIDSDIIDFIFKLDRSDAGWFRVYDDNNTSILLNTENVIYIKLFKDEKKVV